MIDRSQFQPASSPIPMEVNKMAMTEEGQILQFVPFASAIEVGFWHKLTRKKLEEFKLDDSARNIIGSYSNS